MASFTLASGGDVEGIDLANAIQAASQQCYGSVSSQRISVSICLLGGFLLLQSGRPISLRCQGKAQALLGHLAIQRGHRASRDSLLHALWPTSDPRLSSQSLHSLVHSLNKVIGEALGGARLVLHDEDHYRLNVEAGLAVDVVIFDELAEAGDRLYRAGDKAGAVATYGRAVALYRGDLWADVGGSEDMRALLEGERLRARYLTMLVRLADYHYTVRDYPASLTYAWALLARDPWREDAHRLVMQCHVQQGQRAAALRQYHLCEKILRAELDAPPEKATRELFEQIRLNPA